MRKRNDKSNLKTPGGDIVLLTRRTMFWNDIKEYNASVFVSPASSVSSYVQEILVETYGPIPMQPRWTCKNAYSGADMALLMFALHAFPLARDHASLTLLLARLSR